MFTRKFTRYLAMTAVASAASLALAGPPAQAMSARSGPAFYNCQLHATEPSVHRGAITGAGIIVCSGSGWQSQKLVVSIEEYIMPTLIAVRAQASTGYSLNRDLVQRVSWNCTGTGTGVYIIEASLFGQNGGYAYRFSPQKVTLTC